MSGKIKNRWIPFIAISGMLFMPAFCGIYEARAQNYGLMWYRDLPQLNRTLLDLDDRSRHAKVFQIGSSIDYRTNPRRPAIYPIYAIRISESTDGNIGDDYRKNSILFEAGMHPREWLPTESCLMLAEYLVDNAERNNTSVPQLLSKVDVWIIPLSNPSGRAIDDTGGGDPRSYFSDDLLTGGWRGNGDTLSCNYGVNVARNFSSGWGGAQADCTDEDVANYRGFAPFSTLEATALREFVQNHGISMAVVLHSNAEKIWNLWGTDDSAGSMLTTLGEFAWRIYDLGNPELALEIDGVGGGMGQFSAWLASRSNVASEPDENTIRGIQTVFVEMPFLRSNYTTDDGYRFLEDDGSNGFHPSSEHVRDLIRRNFFPLATTMIYEAQSPGCPSFGGCPALDFGVVGAKIGTSQLAAGKLMSYPAGAVDGSVVPARDYLRPFSASSKLYLDYRIQNFSLGSAKDADVRIKLARGGTTLDNVIVTYRNMGRREIRTGRQLLNLDRDNTDYTLSIEIRPVGGFSTGTQDDLTENSKKVFKFRYEQSM